MKYIKELSRYIVAIVFIFSSIVKAVDPVGVSLKVKEYLLAYNAPDFGDFSLVIAIALCAIEFLCGIAILTTVKIRFFSFIALLLTLMFTVITYLSAKYDLVKDCGCFGDAVHLSAWGTFAKNVVLIVLCFIVYYYRKSYRQIINKRVEPLLTLFFLLLIVGLSVYSYFYLPPLDFTDFKRGTDLNVAASGNYLKYKTEVVYEKNGVSEVFDLENLPDSTWTFVETISTLVGGDERDASKTRFVIVDEIQEPVTEDVLGMSSAVLLSVYKDNLSEKYFNKLSDFVESNSLKDTPSAIYLLSSFTPEKTLQILSPLSESLNKWQSEGLFTILYSDYKTLITLNRSNGGATFLNDGVVVKKISALQL